MILSLADSVRDIAAVGVPALTGNQVFRFDLHAYFHGGASDEIDARPSRDQLSQVNWLVKNHAVHAHGHTWFARVTPGCYSPYAIHQ